MGTDGDGDTRPEADGMTEAAGDGPASTVAAPSERQRPPYRSARTLAKVVTALFVLDLALMAGTAVLLLDSLDVARAIVAGQEVTQQSLDSLEGGGGVISMGVDQTAMIAFGLLVACGVVFCVWTYRVAKNATALGRSPSTSPGWAVGYYFIPIVSLWMPYRALAEVWDASDPDPRSDAGAPQSHAFLLSWWLAWAISSGLDGIVLRWGAETAESWIVRIHLGLVATALETIAAALAISVVWQLTRRQDERAAALMPTARIA